MNELVNPKIGVLPLMLELYKDSYPTLAEEQTPFIWQVSDSIHRFSDVVTAPVCTNRDEVRLSVKDFEARDVDGIVILFIAYATSISALNPLLETQLPLLLFSTSPKSSMGIGMSNSDINFNHGVHGYMDLANVLKRNKRQYQFVSGPKDDKKALREIESWARAAGARKKLRRSVIGLAGYTFDGMGDFGIDTTLLNTTFGPEVRHIPLNLLADSIASISDQELDEEAERDIRRFSIDTAVDRDILNESNRVYLGLSKVVDTMTLNALTMHFQGILENPGIKTLPFLAISKLQEQGLAYAGEGDLLGACVNMMVRYLCGETIFTETFCPDYGGGRIVMGHMGESNPAFGTKTMLKRQRFEFGKAIDPVVADVCMKEGTATVINLGIVEDNAFQLITYTGHICENIPDAGDVEMPYFHFKPDMDLPDFLTAYGLAGGTHHVALATGDRTKEIQQFAEMLGIQCVGLS